MRLLYKTILIAMTVILFFSVALYFISSQFIARSYEKLENENVLKDLNTVTYAINDKLTVLEKGTADWAVWDDTYQFALNPDQSYIDLNLNNASLVNADFNFLAVYDLSNRLEYYKFINLETSQSIFLSQADLSQMREFNQRQIDSPSEYLSGFINLDSGTMLAVTHLILHSDNSGPPAGILIKGRLLDAEVMSAIAHSTQLKLSAQHFVGNEMQGLAGESLNPLFINHVYYINKTGPDNLNAYKLIYDYKNQPTLVVQVSHSREIFNESRDTIYWLGAIIVVLALVFVVMTSFLIYVLIISRVKKLTSGLQKVSETSDLTIRVPVSGHDEISILTRQTNRTLDTIALTQFELKASEDRFRQISEVAQDVIYQIALKPNLVIEYISPSVKTTLGFSVDEVIQDTSWLMKAIYAEDREKLLDLFSRAPSASKLDTVLRWIHKDGHTVWVEHSNSVVTDEIGRQIRIIGVGRNISGRVRMESNLVELYQKEKEVRQELEKEAKARAFFIDVLGHELKTPMTPLLISIDILKDQTDPNLTPLQNKLINNAAESVKLLAARLDELLDLARFARGTFRLEPQVFNIKEYLENVTTRFEPALQSRGQMLTVRISPDLARIKADPHRLEQVITNLLSNASKYSGENQEIIFRARDLGGILEIEVEDRGIGISLQEQQRLFEPYHRVEQDRQRFSGLGLGLAVSRQIIEAHGGRLTVTSEVGRGSIFKFTVPLDEVSDKDPSTLQPSLK